jgi:D-glycero-alpha-D-manno-heptose-7-phosphate kinase
MIITRAPYRLSLFGGGTDYPRYYLRNGGLAISIAIDKYCTVSLRKLPPFFSHKFRIRYHLNEEVIDFSDIRHPVVRNLSSRFEDLYKEGFELVHQGDLPAQSGIGSSSAFTNATILAFRAQRGEKVSNFDLALETVRFEQETLKENVGSQDQVATAVGGFNCIYFEENGAIHYRPYRTGSDFQCGFEATTFLVFTGVSRTASEIAENQVKSIDKNQSLLDKIKDLALEANTHFSSFDSWDAQEVGRILAEQWDIKKRLDPLVFPTAIHQIAEVLDSCGAYGVKLLGAGGGGFFVVVGPEGLKDRLAHKYPEFTIVSVRVDHDGAKVIFDGARSCTR